MTNASALARTYFNNMDLQFRQIKFAFDFKWLAFKMFSNGLPNDEMLARRQLVFSNNGLLVDLLFG